MEGREESIVGLFFGQRRQDIAVRRKTMCGMNEKCEERGPLRILKRFGPVRWRARFRALPLSSVSLFTFGVPFHRHWITP